LRTLCEKPPGVGVPPTFTEAQNKHYRRQHEPVSQTASRFPPRASDRKDTGHTSYGCRLSLRMLRFGVP
jgi:hypothetical protein